MKNILLLVLILLIGSCAERSRKKNNPLTKVKYTEKAPTIDGRAVESFWHPMEWQSLDQNWLGGPLKHSDFTGKYKLAWNEEALYLLLSVEDDSLSDRTKDPLSLWWNDDSIEILIDEDNSGGLHQYSTNAYNYKVALDGNVVDIGADKKPKLYNDHVQSANHTEGKTTIWEMAIKVYPDLKSTNVKNAPVTLVENKKIGFALAYSDNDGGKERENLIGSVFILGENKNQGWINADVFGTLLLVK